jgi:AAA domain
LDSEQQELLSKARTAAVGIVSAAGIPGTGKTHIIIQLARKFMPAEDRPQILVTARTNNCVNTLALKLEEGLDAFCTVKAIRPPMIVRFHGVKTEENIADCDVNRKFPPHGDRRPQQFKDLTPEDELDLQRLDIA